MEDINGDKENVETFDGLRTWVAEVERTERVVVEIRVGEILSEVVDRVVEIGIRGQEPPREILRNNKRDKYNVESSQLVQGCLNMEQFDIVKTVGTGKGISVYVYMNTQYKTNKL